MAKTCRALHEPTLPDVAFAAVLCSFKDCRCGEMADAQDLKLDFRGVQGGPRGSSQIRFVPALPIQNALWREPAETFLSEVESMTDLSQLKEYDKSCEKLR